MIEVTKEQLTPDNKHIAPLALPSAALQTLINGPLKAVIPAGFTLTGGARLSGQQADECAQILERWTPPAGWYQTGKEYAGLCLFMDFFRRCSGCTVTTNEVTDGDL